MKNKKQVLQAVAVLGCAIVILCAVYSLRLRLRSPEVVLVNSADEAVIRATVEINGAKFEFDGIAPGATRTMKYKPQAGNQYKISVEFHYERTLGPATGTFSDRSGTDHQLVIKREEIVLESGRN